MFFHAVRKVAKAGKSKSLAQLKKEYDTVGLKPIVCMQPVESFMINDFGHIRNDIQQFMMTNDPRLQASIVRNLETVTQSGANEGLTIEDIRDRIIPQNVQTPADIAQFGRVLAKKFEGKVDFKTSLNDLQVKKDTIDFKDTETPKE